MRHDMDRKQHWDELYARKSPLDVSWYQADPVLSLELILGTGARQDARILDVGGGASVLVDRLAQSGFCALTVLDISSCALEHAQQRLGASANQIEWIEADVLQFRPPHVYDVWHDRAVFHFLTEAVERRQYVRVLHEALAPTGSMIVAAFALDGPDRCSDLEVVRYDAAGLCAEFGPGFVLTQQVDELHISPDGGHQKFGFYRFTRA
jgi:2-polyprenyl-3-methyl-5-hydroxy-6-metoxy-1,4-benzoquinol methylase